MSYSLYMPYLMAFYAKLNEVLKIEFHFALEVSFSILYGINFEARAGDKEWLLLSYFADIFS